MSRSINLIALAGIAATLMAAGPPPSLSAAPAPSVTLGNDGGQPKVRPIIATVGADYTAAPVPNADAGIPFVKNPRQNQAQLGPGIFQTPQTGYRGEGYVPGSTAESEQQRKLKPGGGINLKVPLN